MSIKYFKILIACVTSLIALGCSERPYQFTNTTPAVLTPVNYTDINDSRQEFKELFCSLLQSYNQNPCTDYFRSFSEVSAPLKSKRLNRINLQKMHVVLIPGIFGECIVDEVAPFELASKYISDKYSQIRFTTLKSVRGRASSQFNSRIIASEIQKIKLADKEKLVIIGYSKGTTDFLHYLASYNDNKISAFVSVSGVVNGTQIADIAGEEGNIIAAKVPLKQCPKQDSSGIKSLQLSEQFKWLQANMHIFDNSIEFYTVASASMKQNTSKVFKSFHKLLSSYAGINDGQVAVSNQILPRSKLLAVLNADHWAPILPFSRKGNSDLSAMNKVIKTLANKNEFPREVLLEAILHFVNFSTD